MTSPVITYAQNFEDLFLYRCFSGKKTGFYVDVGAYHPTHDSVTKLFYDKGWSGINIEANPTLIDNFMRFRVRDINLNFMIGEDCDGFGQLNVPFSNLGLGSSSLELINTNKCLRNYAVRKTTLSKVLKDYNFFDIDFLKLDIEGAELSALAGLDLLTYRPKIIIVEIFNGSYNTVNISAINTKMKFFKYNYAYCDGINNYYVCYKYNFFERHFIYPINILDNYMRYSEFCLQSEINYLKNL
jgi:FkbM family methyltransferase